MATKTQGKPRRMRGRTVTVTQGARAPLCAATNADGAPCGRSTLDPSRLCPQHRQKAAGGPGFAAGGPTEAVTVSLMAPAKVAPPPDPLAEKVPEEEIVVLPSGGGLALPTPAELVDHTGAGDEMLADLAARGIDPAKIDQAKAWRVRETVDAVTGNRRAQNTLKAYRWHVGEVERSLCDELGCIRSQLWPMPPSLVLYHLGDYVDRSAADPDAPAIPIPETPCIVEVGEIDPDTGERRPCKKPTTHPSKWCTAHGARPCTAEVGEIDPATDQRRGCKRRTDHPSALCPSHRQRLAGKVAPGTVAQRVNAIAHAHKTNYPDHPNLAEAQSVKNFLAGYKRDYESAAKGRGAATPLRTADLVKVVKRIGVPDPRTPKDDRDAALVELSAGDDGMALTKLVTVTWDQVSFLEDGGVELHLTDGRRGTDWVQVVALDQHQAAAIRALKTRFAPGDRGPVFRAHLDDTGKRFTDDDDALSDRGATKIVRAALAAHGVKLPPRGLPALPAKDRHAAAHAITHPAATALTAKDHRDRAMIVCGWWRAARRSNIVGLNWGHVLVAAPKADGTGGGVDIYHRRSKTDQKAEGSWGIRVPAALNDDGTPNVLDPVTAIEAWRSEWTRLMGRPPTADDPVYVRLTPSGDSVPRTEAGAPQAIRLTGETVNNVVADRCAAVNLDDGYTGHSLRRGMATSVAAGGGTVEAVAEIGEWASFDMAKKYIEQADRTHSKGHDAVLQNLLAGT